MSSDRTPMRSGSTRRLAASPSTDLLADEKPSIHASPGSKRTHAILEEFSESSTRDKIPKVEESLAHVEHSLSDKSQVGGSLTPQMTPTVAAAAQSVTASGKDDNSQVYAEKPAPLITSSPAVTLPAQVVAKSPGMTKQIAEVREAEMMRVSLDSARTTVFPELESESMKEGAMCIEIIQGRNHLSIQSALERAKLKAEGKGLGQLSALAILSTELLCAKIVKGTWLKVSVGSVEAVIRRGNKMRVLNENGVLVDVLIVSPPEQVSPVVQPIGGQRFSPADVGKLRVNMANASIEMQRKKPLSGKAVADAADRASEARVLQDQLHNACRYSHARCCSLLSELKLGQQVDVAKLSLCVAHYLQSGGDDKQLFDDIQTLLLRGFVESSCRHAKLQLQADARRAGVPDLLQLCVSQEMSLSEDENFAVGSLLRILSQEMPYAIAEYPNCHDPLALANHMASMLDFSVRLYQQAPPSDELRGQLNKTMQDFENVVSLKLGTAYCPQLRTYVQQLKSRIAC